MKFASEEGFATISVMHLHCGTCVERSQIADQNNLIIKGAAAAFLHFEHSISK